MMVSMLLLDLSVVTAVEVAVHVSVSFLLYVVRMASCEVTVCCAPPRCARAGMSDCMPVTPPTFHTADSMYLRCCADVHFGRGVCIACRSQAEVIGVPEYPAGDQRWRWSWRKQTAPTGVVGGKER